ncbi:MAG TPA: tetratricopeptide repeat protein [Thermoanaerobaculia bacterium]|nr:tetratricopeptide repeat protein [Thermoanaerobaculia bacterium]
MTPPPPRGARLALFAVLVAAALLRLLHWWTMRDQPFVGQPVLDSAEYDRWARELLAGGWRGGGAFFQAPFYPYLVAAVYAVAGARPSAVYLLQIAVAVGAIWALWRCGLRLAGWPVGLAAAALAALSGVLVFHDVLLLKESLATSGMAFLLLALVAAREPGARRVWWLVAGALLGTIAELRENALLLVPLVLALPWLRADDEPVPPRRALGASALLLAGVLLALAPFALRNVVVTGQPLLTTFQGGVNFWIGNNPEADGTYRPLVAGRQVPERERAEAVRLAEQAVGHALSPREVSRYWLRRALAWAASDPGAFLHLQLRKLALFWSPYEWPDAVDYAWVRQQSPALRAAFVERGALSLLALAGLWLVRRDLRRWAPVLILLAGWMAITVAFFLFSRYRLPAVPALALLAAVPLVRLAEAVRSRRAVAATAGAAAVVAAFALPHVFMPPPRLDLVHGNLGRLADQRGDAAAAETHYRAALAAAPDDLLALLGLGNAAARGRRYDDALALYRRAAAAHPGSPEAFANVGAAELALGQVANAERDLRHALALDPEQPQAKRNLALLLARRNRLDV